MTLLCYWCISITLSGGFWKGMFIMQEMSLFIYNGFIEVLSCQYAIQYLYVVWSNWLYFVAAKGSYFNMLWLTSILLLMYPTPFKSQRRAMGFLYGTTWLDNDCFHIYICLCTLRRVFMLLPEAGDDAAVLFKLTLTLSKKQILVGLITQWLGIIKLTQTDK